MHTITVCKNSYDRICWESFVAYAAKSTNESMMILQDLVAQGHTPYRLIGWEGIHNFRYYLVPGPPAGMPDENLIGCSVQEVVENTKSLLGDAENLRLLGFEQYLGNLGRLGAAKIGLRLPPRDEPFQIITGHLVN
jgi:hypothetical protein